jgi:hypothetical protein
MEFRTHIYVPKRKKETPKIKRQVHQTEAFGAPGGPPTGTDAVFAEGAGFFQKNYW